MNKVFSVLGLAIFLMSQQPTGAQAPVSRTLRVTHWNAFYDGTGTDGVRSRGRQVAALAGLNSDVITLNEVTAGATVDYAARLERATGVRWNHHFGTAHPAGWGNAILSRYPIVSTSVYKMKIGAARNIAQATIDVDGSHVNVFVTHLDCCDRPRNRSLQVKELLAYLEGFAAPRIFTGDMNAAPDASEIQPFSVDYDDVWLSAVHRGTARAYPANPAHKYTRTRRGRLDYIYTSRDMAARDCSIPDLRDLSNTNVTTLLRTSDDQGVRPSDHNLVSCAVTWSAPGKPETPDPPDTDPDPDPSDPGGTDNPGDTQTPGDTDNPGGSDNPGGTEDPGDNEDTDEPDPPPPPPVDTCEETTPPAVDLQPAEMPTVTSHDDIVLRTATAGTVKGNWILERDCSAAGGARLVNPDLNLARERAASEPVDYFELTFTADAGKPYRLWMRGKAADDSWQNDSVSIQFSGSVDARGVPVFRIGTEDRTLLTLEDCVSCGMSGWGWQDNGFGAGVLGPEIYFETTGPQTIRVQRREDGVSIDQIVLSATTWLAVAPGASKNDTTILPAPQP